MIILYNKITNKIYSYISATRPDLQKCADNHNISIDEVGCKKWTKDDPQDEDFKDLITELNQEKLEEL